MAAPSIVVSPTPSSRVSLETTDSTRRTSLDSQRSGASASLSNVSPSNTPQLTTSNSASVSPARRTATGSVRNRSALREFYGLKKREEGGNDSDGSTSGGRSSSRGQVGLGITTTNSLTPIAAAFNLSSPVPTPTFPEMDKDTFSPEKFVADLLSREDLRGLLRVENELVNDIRGLDGDRKSLVYDNYNKLIKATDTIRNMRSSMEPLTPATSTLFPAVSHIASISEGLADAARRKNDGAAKEGKEGSKDAEEEDRREEVRKKRETVKWVLECPGRMEKMVAEGNREDAVKEWEAAVRIMEKWKGVGGDGVKELKAKGDAILAS